MKAITENAGEKLQQVLDKANVAEDQRVRFAATPEGYSLLIDKECPDDKVLTYNDRPVLVVGPAIAQKLQDRTLDFSEGQFCFS